MCPNDPNQSKIMEKGIKNSVYIKLRDTADIKHLPDAHEGDKFNLQVIGMGNGEAVIKNQALVWSNNGQPVIKSSDIDKVRGKSCASWFVDMFVSSKFDGNCCFSFMSQKSEKTICETSSFCIQKAKKMFKFLVMECHKSAATDGSFGSSPGQLPNRPFYKCEETKNYGWDEYLGEKEEASGPSEHVDNIQQADEIPSNGIIPPPFNPELSDADRDAFRSIAPADKTLIDRHEEG